MSTVAFGNVDVTSGSAVVTSTTFGGSCNGNRRELLLICAHLGPGSGGTASNGNPRTLLAGASDLLNYNLFLDPNYAQPWGSLLHGWAGSQPMRISTQIGSNGRLNLQSQVYGRVPGGQSAAAVGAYASTFSGAMLRIRYGYIPNAETTCDSLTGFIETTASFTVQAQVVPRCTVSAATLDFGATSALQTARDGASAVSVVCTRNAPYAIGLGGGLSNSTDPARRRMTQGGNSIIYGLYRDVGRVQPWGATIGTNTTAGTGTGSTQSFPIFGRVPAQPTPALGAYSDTVSVTITY
jgi:spore coat protein U-like protein